MNETNMTHGTNTISALGEHMPTHSQLGLDIFLALLPWVLLMLLMVLLVWLVPRAKRAFAQVDLHTLLIVFIVLAAGFGFSQTYFGSHEASDYIPPLVLFWLRYGFGLGAALMLPIIPAKIPPPPATVQTSAPSGAATMPPDKGPETTQAT